ncbi:MAG TPA: SRPBCC domain-containing protein [Mycobacteriales bacterium]|nr:SRPBCC domain-containing protein [Mycobacteriales bacterium]
MTAIAPVRRSVTVVSDPGTAFRVFTEEMAAWWPLLTHSVGGADAVGVTVEPRVGGRVVERLRSGAEETWGTVTEWSPPTRLGLTWHPGRAPSEETRVVVTFSAVGAETLVELEHTGWESRADGAAIQRNYDEGWVLVLGAFATRAGAAG